MFSFLLVVCLLSDRVAAGRLPDQVSDVGPGGDVALRFKRILLHVSLFKHDFTGRIPLL